MSEAWYAYLLVSTQGRRSYIGIALDPSKRLRQHNGELVGGARSTRAGRPWKLVATRGPFADRAAAQRAEADWKRLDFEARLQSAQG